MQKRGIQTYLVHRSLLNHELGVCLTLSRLARHRCWLVLIMTVLHVSYGSPLYSQVLDSSKMSGTLKIWDIEDRVSVLMDRAKNLKPDDVLTMNGQHMTKDPYDPSVVYWLKIPLYVAPDAPLLLHTGNSNIEVYLSQDGIVKRMEADRFKAYHLPVGDSLLILRSIYPNKPFHSLSWIRQDQWPLYYFSYITQSSAFRAIILSFAFYNLAQFLFGFRMLHLWYAFNQIMFVVAIEGVNAFFTLILNRTVPLDFFAVCFLVQNLSSSIYGVTLLGWRNIQKWMLISLAICFASLVLIIAFSIGVIWLAPFTQLICILTLIMVWSITAKVRGHTFFAALGWTFIIISYSIFSAHDLGWVERYNEFWGYWLITAESCFFSLSMGKEKQDKITQLLATNRKSLAESELLRQQLAESNVELERKVEARTQDIQVILRNVRQGLFPIMNSRFQIGPFFSPYLKEILALDSVPHDHVWVAFLEALDLNRDQKQTLISCLEASFDQDEIAFELNHTHLPGQARLVVRGEVKWIEISWDPVLDSQRVMRQLIVSIRDVTEVRRLESDRLENQTKMLTIGVLVNAGRSAVLSFLRRWKQVEVEFQDLELKDIDNRSFCDTLFLQLHTFKGAARSIGLQDLAALIHDQEDLLLHLSRSQQALEELRVQILDPLKTSFLELEDICTIDLGWSLDDTLIEVKREQLLDVLKSLHRYMLPPEAQRHMLSFAAEFCMSLERSLHELMQEAESLAKRLGKDPPEITISVTDRLLTDRGRSLLQGIWPHLISNALDHGLESTEERQAVGKPRRGSLRVQTISQAPYTLSFADDGRGLDLKKLASSPHAKRLAQKLGRPLTLHETAELIFEHGLSTRETVSEISGRGVGVSAVEQQLRAMGGKITLDLDTDDSHLTGRRGFRFCLTLPEDCFFLPLPLPSASSSEKLLKPIA